MIGVVAGLGAITFQLLSQVIIHFTLSGIGGFAPQEAEGEYHIFPHVKNELSLTNLMIIITAGGLASGFLVYTFAPEAEGHGTDAAIDAFHNKRGMIRARIPIIKTLASAITIGTGGSGGREGPIAQIGAGFGSFLATKLNLSARDRRIMLAAGMGAGVGAIFRAPLAGALFAGEIMYRDADLESDVIVPAAIASIVGYSVYGLSLPSEIWFSPLLGNKLKYTLGSPLELFSYGVLSLVLVVVAVIYIKVFYGTHKLFKKLPIPPHFRPAIGAALAGLCGIAFYLAMDREPHAMAVLSTGYGSLQQALIEGGALADKSREGLVVLLLLIALIKIVTTSLTISSGGSGGVFGPSMVIGGCLGAAVGQYFQRFEAAYPNWVANPQAYAIVGMAGFFAGCAMRRFRRSSWSRN